MTDDTLREECQTLAKALIQSIDFTDDQAQRPPEMVAKLLAFARAQQAKGLREAAGEIVRKLTQCDIENIYTVNELPQLKSWLETTATVRENQT